MLDQLAENMEWFIGHGVRVAAVTMGKPYEAKMFCAQRNPDIVCLSNPDQSAYKEFHIGRMGVKEMLDPGLALNGARIALKGSYKIGTPADMDALQLGATFIIDSTGQLRFVHYNHNQYDHPEMVKLKSVVEELSVTEKHDPRIHTNQRQ
jgi:peroxiredoxin